MREPERRRVEAFGAKLEAAVEARDASFLIDRIDAVAMSSAAAKGTQLSAEDKAELTRRARDISAAYGTGVLRGLGERGRYTFVRAAELDKRPAAIVRVLSGDGSFDYHGWFLEPRGLDDFKLVDVHIFVVGRSISQLIHDIVEARAAEGSKKTCPRASLVLRLRAAKQRGDEARVEAILDEVERLPAVDPARGSLLLDRLVARARFAEAHDALTRLDESVGGDPYLWALRASLFFFEKKTDLAKAELMRAIAAQPSLEEGYLGLIGISLKERSFKDTARWLIELQEKTGGMIESIAEVPEYAEFVRSPEFAAWEERQKALEARGAACLSIIKVLNTGVEERSKKMASIRDAPTNPAAYRDAAEVTEGTASALSKIKVDVAEVAALSADFRSSLQSLASTLRDMAAALEAKDAPRVRAAAEAIGKAETKEDALADRMNSLCQGRQ
jgi:hypothetical protein